MKLNAEAVRDVLLYLEQNLEYNDTEYEAQKIIEPISVQTLVKVLTPSKHYTDNEVRYAVKKLWENQMIHAKVSTGTHGNFLNFQVLDITWSGHEFLNNVRPQTIWEITKDKASKLGGMSIKMLSFLSSTIIQAVASNHELIQSIVNNLK